jgi:tetratricopeptide (TPR) repeat protein
LTRFAGWLPDPARALPDEECAAIGYSEGIRCVRVILTLFTLAVSISAQEEGDQWRDLLTEAQRAAGNNQPAQAEESYTKALHEAERFGADDWRVGTTLQELGELYRSEKKSSDAVSALQRALAIAGKNNDDGTEAVASVRYDLGGALLDAGRPVDALSQARRALATYQSIYGGTSAEAADASCLLGDSLRVMRLFTDAEEPLRRCADVREQKGGIDSVELADALYSLALTYAGEKKYREAEPRFSMAEKIRENKLGITSPLLAQTMEDHAALLRTLGRDKEADRLEKFAQAILHTEKKK